MTAAFPIVRPVGASAILVELGDGIDEAISGRVIALDRALLAEPLAGLVETVPAYAALMIVFDPLVADVEALSSLALRLARDIRADERPGREHVVPVCYDGPDLDAVAQRTGLSREQAIGAHLSGDYRVYMYGFAPGYAYLGGVPQALQLPRKPAAERGHPVGSIIIAGAQCLITTLPMPTGWWVIGNTPLRVLDPAAEQPFRFDPGDRIRFEQIE
ncbi:5-oxoprolinase subunit B family protein [Sphingomonas sp. SRS2]|uniref:5-oxoprolinase subunit B family protein n=1 Tax=Sphingomonas sp. SRS2 TaxID=133190 RepID=UPI000618405E|nr:allophanate hydrolase subunit 1 [Sphingomonas sp. SRS2]KKC24139.1 kinase [Sphingomonas sp. SRS2]